MDDLCVAVVVPVNGFLSARGDDWRCDRGFKKDNNACSPVTVPANAHLDYSGDDWTCSDGFRRRGARCIAD